jgi:hypothetical protein
VAALFFCPKIKKGILTFISLFNSLFEVESKYYERHLCTKNINSIFSRVNNGPDHSILAARALRAGG